MNVEIQQAIDSIRPPNATVHEAAQSRLRQQIRPAGSLGMLEPVAARLAAIAGTLDVRLKRKVIVTCAGDHGICEEGVSLFPAEVTPQMVFAFVAGAASINALARHAGADVYVADLGVNFDFDPSLPILHYKVAKGTANFARGPAMTRDQAEQSVVNGIRIVKRLHAERSIDLLGTGDMGIGNTTPSSAIIATLSGLAVSKLTGRGTGLDDTGVQRKIAAIEKGLTLNKPRRDDPLDVLAKVGGFEIGGLAGLVLGAASLGIPVICDGLISTAGALIACEMAPAAKAYLFASHRSVETGHRFMHDHLGMSPLLDLQLRLGEGTGAALAMELLDASTRVLAEIKTFDEMKVTDAQK